MDGNLDKLKHKVMDLYKSGRYYEALPIAKQVVESRKIKAIKKPGEYATSLKHLALVYNSLGKYGEAELLYKEALTIRKKNFGEDTLLYADIINNLAILYLDMNENNRAEPLFKKAVEIKWAIFGVKNISYASSLAGLAIIYQDQDKYDLSESLWKEVLIIRNEILGENHPSYANSLNNLGMLYSSRGNNLKALSFLQEALMIRKKLLGVKHPDYVTSMNNLAGVYAALGEYSKAELLYKEVLAISKEKPGKNNPADAYYLSNLAYMYCDWNKINLAFKCFVEFFNEINSYMNEMKMWASEKRLYNISNYISLSYDFFYSLFSQHYLNHPNQNIRQSLDVHLVYKGRIAEALAVRNRLAVISKDPEMSYIVKKLNTINRIISDLSFSGSNDDLGFRQWQIAGWEEDKQKLEQKLTKGTVEFAKKRLFKAVIAETVAKALPNGSVYIDFVKYNKYDFNEKKWIKEKHYLSFLLKNSEDGTLIVRAKELGPAEEIDTLVTRFRNIIFNRGETERIKSIGKLLYEKLLRPFESEIRSSSYLIFSPSSNLYLIPFEILWIPDQKTYLLDRYSILYCMGRNLMIEKFLQDSLSRQSQFQSALPKLFVAPDFDNTTDKDTKAQKQTLHIPIERSVKGWPLRLDPLPGALTEGNMILRKIGKENVTMFSGTKANEKNFKSINNPRFLHIATHGFFLEDVKRVEPVKILRGIKLKLLLTMGDKALKGSLYLHNPLLRSGLALAGFNRLANGIEISSSENDGILSAMEITGIDLNRTELVVLSACETGIGKTQRGEGVIGLRRSFRIAGARNVLMSLWNIPDKETVWLMEAFYDSYLGGATPTVAIQRARKKVRNRLKSRDGIDHPFYWAAFIVEGPPFPIDER